MITSGLSVWRKSTGGRELNNGLMRWRVAAGFWFASRLACVK